jgi:hypothetical protein
MSYTVVFAFYFPQSFIFTEWKAAVIFYLVGLMHGHSPTILIKTKPTKIGIDKTVAMNGIL